MTSQRCTRRSLPNYLVITYFNNGFHPRSFRICCVVLQGCPRSHSGISKSQTNEIVNLIASKNYSRMILLNSEKQSIEGIGGGGGRGGGLFGCNYD